MRVLHLANSLASQDGGPSVILRALATRQAVHGHKVYVRCPSGSATGNESDAPRKLFNVDLAYAPRVTGSFSPTLSFKLPSPRDIDVVHLHGVFGSAAHAALKMSRARVPVIVRPCGMLEKDSLTLGRASAKRAHLQLVERPLLDRAAAVHTTSEAERENLLEDEWRARARVIPLGVEVPDRAPPRDPRPNQVLFYSRLHDKKRPSWILDLLARAPELTAVFAGDGPARAALETRARVECLPARFVGHVGARKRDQLLDESAVMVLPSKTENFAAVVVECWARGVPVVMTPGVALSRAAPGPQPTDDIDDVLRAVRETLTTPPSPEALHRRALEYSWPRFLARLDDLYSETAA